MADDVAWSVGSVAEGYPCPKDGTTLMLIEDKTGERRHLGGWCPQCHTVWRELLETSVFAVTENTTDPENGQEGSAADDDG